MRVETSRINSRITNDAGDFLATGVRARDKTFLLLLPSLSLSLSPSSTTFRPIERYLVID